MTLILGIDPGSRITGFGVVQQTPRGCIYVASGCIRTGAGELAERLQIVYRGVREVIQTYGPVTMGIEKVFMAKNADSALKLGQARGAAIVAGAEEGMEIAEYTATQVKQAVVGTGAANKEQVQRTKHGARNVPMKVVGLQIQYVGIGQQSRKPIDDGFTIFFTDTNIDCHVFPLQLRAFIDQVQDHSSKSAGNVPFYTPKRCAANCPGATRQALQDKP